MEEKTKNKYLTKFTPIQEKFIDNYCSKYGEISATQCAINAGYARSSAHTRAAELLDWKKHPGVCLEIQERLAGLRQAWDIDKDKHLGRVTGLYIEKSMVLTKEISDDEITNKFKNIFDSPEEYIAHAAEHAKELWPDRSMKKAKKTKPK